MAFLLACFATLGLAAEALEEALDADFLSYLAELESEDDDWTIVELPTDRSRSAASEGAQEQSAKPDSPARERPPSVDAPKKTPRPPPDQQEGKQP